MVKGIVREKAGRIAALGFTNPRDRLEMPIQARSPEKKGG